jgi:UPF0176 protein
MKNTYNHLELENQNNEYSVAVLSFYSFVNLPEPEKILPKILLIAKKKCIKGTITIAQEGFNGSISGEEANLHLLVEKLRNLTNPKDINIKVNYCAKQPFTKIKVKLKDEIVSMRSGSIDVENLKGEYIEASDWDQFIKESDVVVVDTRNSYEVKAGSFKKAIDPHTENFRDFSEWAKSNKELFENKKIAMFCTGGIRCEKSTAYMKTLGYEKLYHLKGGILQYLEDTKNKNGVWEGDCFVFDDRGAVNCDLLPTEGYWVQKGQTAKSVSINK